MLVTGDVLDGRYRLEEQIAAGGMGAVWRATDTLLGRLIAIKVMHPRLDGGAAFGDRFRTEARTMAALHHPGIVEIYDYGEVRRPDGGSLAYLVMAYIRGQSLSRRIGDAGALTPAQTLPIIAQAATALAAAHAAGVIHRDVKPANLLIEPDGRVILVDFGIARTAEDAALTAADDVVGTAPYMAPEQVARREVSPAVDIYALGAVAYHCLTGRAPFTGPDPVAVALAHLNAEPPPLPATLPNALRVLVTTAMAKNPADRYPSGTDMAAAARAAESEIIAASGPAEPPQRLPLRTAWLPAPATPADSGTIPLDKPPPTARRRAVRTLATALMALAGTVTVLGIADPLGVPAVDDRPPTQSPAPSGPGRATDPARKPAVPGVRGPVRPVPAAPRTTGTPPAAPGPSSPSPGTGSTATPTPATPTPEPTTAEPSKPSTPPSSIPGSGSPSTATPGAGGSATTETAPRRTTPTADEPESAGPSTAVSAEPIASP